MRPPRWLRPLSFTLAAALALPATAMVATAVEQPLSAPTTIRATGLVAEVSEGFPQVLRYSVGEGESPTEFRGNPELVRTVLIDGQEYIVSSVSAFQEGPAEVSYTVRFEGTDAVMKASLVAENVRSQQRGTEGAIRPAVTFTITEFTGAHTIQIPKLGLVSISSDSADNQYAIARTGTVRGGSSDRIGTLTAKTEEATMAGAYTFLASRGLAVGLETNATPERVSNQEAGRLPNSNGRWTSRITSDGEQRVLSTQPGEWTYRSGVADEATGDDPRPYASVIFTSDANKDGAVNWQDGAIAYADIAEEVRGTEANHNYVVSHIPFNFASQATHPFQRTADDVKRISLATDGLGQRVMLKGYGAEGHDSAHVDYAGHTNPRAGGESGLKAMLDATRDVNAIYGVHVNSTEAYAESHDFGTLPFTGGRGWNWLGQSYYIDQHQDLGSGAITKRFQDFRDQYPLSQYPNFRWIYMDVYYGSGWTADRLGHELNAMGWELGSEWSEKFERHSTWSHWSNDENYGGYTNKGLNSEIIRFIDNANKDTWNPNVVLGYPQIVEFEGWTGHTEQRGFYRNIWANNLPAKFLQDSRIMSSSSEVVDGGTRLTYTFANGTVATGISTLTADTPGNQVATVSAADMAASRSFTYDGAEVLRGSAYLLPWTDNGTAAGAPRLYHYNPAGTETTWTLPASYASQSSLTLYRLSDSGKVKVADLPVSGGQVTIPASVFDGVPAADLASTAFVAYPAQTPSAVTEPTWGEGTYVSNPGFDGGLSGYDTAGAVTATTDARRDPIASLGAGQASLSQKLQLPAGTYEASAWVEIGGGAAARDVELSVAGAGVSPTGNQDVAAAAGSAAAPGGAQFGSTPASPENPQTTVFEDFENVTQGWGPFVKGNAGGSTDPRTVLAPKNAPWTQAGATLPDGRTKPTDDVIAGHWSLRSHEENDGLIYRSVPQTVPFKAGHRYRVSFDYENAYEGAYSWVTGYTRTTANGPQDFLLDRTSFSAKHTPTRFVEEFTAGACGATFLALERGTASGAFNDFTMDNFRVEDLGPAADAPGCLLSELSFAATPQAGTSVAMTATVYNNGDTPTTGVVAGLALPQGWSGEVVAAGPVDLAPGEHAVFSWNVQVPAEAAGQEAEARIAVGYMTDGEQRTTSAVARTQVLRSVRADAVTYLSDLPFSERVETANGWGPIERDTANGENERGDGPAISLGGTEYAKGLGTHAYARAAFDLGGQCHTFAATVGVQDGKGGSIAFRVSKVVGDQVTALHETEVLTSSSTPQEITADVTGADAVLLEVLDGGNGIGSDHGSWANARVACGTAGINDDPNSGGHGGGSDQPAATVPYTGPMTLVAAPGAYSANPAELMFDADPATFYDKNWISGVAPHPSDIDLALLPSVEATSGEAQTVQGLSVTGRASQANGRIARYEVYAGQDPGNLTTLVATGTLKNEAGEQKIVFDRPLETKFLRLRVLSSYRTKTSEPEGLLAVAELGILAPDPDAASDDDAAGNQGGSSDGADGSGSDGSAQPGEGDASGATESSNGVNIRVDAGAGLTPEVITAIRTVADDAPAGTVTTRLNRSVAKNYVAADQKHSSYFQRVPVRFTLAADGEVTFSIVAGDGDATVLVDDLRLVRIAEDNLKEADTSAYANAALAQRLQTVPGAITKDVILEPGAFQPLTPGARNSSGLGIRSRISDDEPSVPDPTDPPSDQPTEPSDPEPSEPPTDGPSTEPSEAPSVKPSEPAYPGTPGEPGKPADPNHSTDPAKPDSSEQPGDANSPSSDSAKKADKPKRGGSRLARTGVAGMGLLGVSIFLVTAGLGLGRRRNSSES